MILCLYLFVLYHGYFVLFLLQRDNGMRGLFRGLPASLMGIVPYSGTDLAMFYTLKARWMAANPDAKVIWFAW